MPTPRTKRTDTQADLRYELTAKSGHKFCDNSQGEQKLCN